MSESPPPSSSSTEEIPYLTPSPPQQEQQNMNRHQFQNFASASIPSMAQTSPSDRFNDTDSYMDVLAVASAATQLALSLNFDNEDVDVPGTQLESQTLMRQPSRGSPLITPNLVGEDTSANDACLVLPDVPMLNIFGRLSLYQMLVTLPQVSPLPTWMNLVHEASNSRRQLTILLGDEAETLLEDVLTQFPSLSPADQACQLIFLEHRLSPEASRILTSKMPRISCLTLVITQMDEQEYAQILRLLHAWAGHLTQLIFAIDPKLRSPIARAFREQALSLQEALNGLSQLRHLTIWMRNWLDVELLSDALLFDLPVFSALESLRLSSLSHPVLLRYPVLFRQPALFLNSIVRYMDGSAAARQSIHLADAISLDELELLLSMPGGVTRLISSLHFATLSASQFISLTDVCTSLTSLTVDLGNKGDRLSLTLLSSRLPSLTLLTSLTLAIGDLDAHLDALEESRLGLPAGEVQLLSPLPSVTSLTVHIYGSLRSHADLPLLYLHQLLPNVERLLVRLGHLQCPICHLLLSWEDHPAFVLEACARQLVAPLVPLLTRLQLAQSSVTIDGRVSFLTLHRAHLGLSGELITVDVAEENATVMAQRDEERDKRRPFRWLQPTQLQFS